MSTDHSSAAHADLLKHPGLWRAGELKREPETVASGYELLDRHLPGRGWPRAGLCDFMLQTAGVGELRLLMPALARLSRQTRWIAWVNPPFVPYAPALEATGVDIDKILLIHPKTHKDALWALERASKSGTCSAALGWLDERQLDVKDTRRLQLAARQGGTLTCLFRPEQAREVNSMAELRLQMQPAQAANPDLNSPGLDLPDLNLNEVSVTICKRRGGWPVTDLTIRMYGDENRHPAEIREQLSLWRRWRAAESRTESDPLALVPPLSPMRGDTDQHITH